MATSAATPLPREVSSEALSLNVCPALTLCHWSQWKIKLILQNRKEKFQEGPGSVINPVTWPSGSLDQPCLFYVQYTPLRPPVLLCSSVKGSDVPGGDELLALPCIPNRP